ncbi:Histidine kinase [Devosia sp. LC5]|uniref:ATP-binding protein n=1 Tax=Devosia sp. LC5 TaxID=1502724 RepID=UPI0004E2E89F|nr:ATP-binding protein [Devosia sp. LC5]KFC66201.1 Histidine kinase [Devosia sp. LC5]
MRSLRFRIAAILIGAIVVVVLVATTAVIFALNQPDPDRMVVPVASQIVAISAFFDENLDSASQVATQPSETGPLRPDLTDALQARLGQSGVDLPVAVHDKIEQDGQLALVEVAGRQLAVEFPNMDGPPPELWIALAYWLGLIVLGVIAVSLFMAYRVTRPFAMLENAVNSVSSDGVIPHIPEVGSGEARQTASALNRLSARLKSAVESRMRLVAAAGHDLRTPMTRMRIRVEFLPDEDRDSWIKDIDELELIADSAIRLVREEVSWGDHSPVELHKLLAETVEELQAQHYLIELGRLDGAIIDLLPSLAMRRALRNLLINAATHGKGGTVSLVANGSSVVIEIADKGPGIPQDLLMRVFEPFFRAEPGRVQTIPGAGLGLAIAKEIIERSGGQLEIRNGQSGGLVQTVTLRG